MNKVKKDNKKNNDLVINANREEYESYDNDIDEFCFFNRPTHHVFKHYDKTIKSILKKFDKKKINVLDVACGSGGVSKLFFKDKRCHVTAVDLSKKQLSFYRKKINSNRLKTVCSDVESFLKKQKKLDVDILIIASALHHFVNYKKIVSDIVSQYNPKVVYFPREPFQNNVKGSVKHKIITYVDDQFAWPYSYYNKKGTIPWYKRYAIIFGTPILSPIIRTLEPYGNSPVNWILRRKKKVPAKLVELYSHIDLKGLTTILQKNGYLVNSDRCPEFFFEFEDNLAKKFDIPFGHFELIAFKS